MVDMEVLHMSENNAATNPVTRALVTGLDKAIAVHQPVIAAHVRRIRTRHAQASPAQVIAMLEKQYLATVVGTGAAAGGVAAAPAVGTAVSIAVSVGARPPEHRQTWPRA